MLGFDLNCDMGEIEETWFSGRDKEILKYITSINISCGEHAGSERLIDATLDEAISLNLNIGAHPSFPDRQNFGRKHMDLDPQELDRICRKQIMFLKSKVEKKGGRLHHVKPHGALYNLAAIDENVAGVLCECIATIDDSLLVFGPPDSCIIQEAKKCKLGYWVEGFADRRYQKDGLLVPRKDPLAIFKNWQRALSQVNNIIKHQYALTWQAEEIPIKVQTICIHGDTNYALELAQTIDKQHNV